MSLRRVGISVLALALVCAPAPAGAADDPLRPPVLVVEDLLGEDWKAARAARDEVARLGARAVPALLAARAAAPARHSVRQPIDDALAGIVHRLAEEVGRPLLAPAERITADGALGGTLGAADRERPDLSIEPAEPATFGDLGAIDADVPQDWWSKRERARRARGALASLGPAVTGALLTVPPLREQVVQRALGLVANHLYAVERERALALPDTAAREAFLARYAGLADLAQPVVAAGLRDEDPAVRAVFQAVRDDVLGGALARLDDPDPDLRRGAEEVLLRLGPLAQQPLVRIAQGADGQPSAQAGAAAERLARWIRYGVDRELVRRLGHDFAGYAARPFRERRELVFELERLGGARAIPALRSLLREEVSDEVRTVAAIGLFRQGDPTGAEWLALHRSGIPLSRISKHELAAIFMDQGLRYLTLGRFERAEREFKQVLEVEPRNEIAWYNLACTYSRWGKVDLALEHLAKAIEYGFDDAGHMAQDPDLDPLREDPRFKAMMARLRGESPPDGEGGDDAERGDDAEGPDDGREE